MAAYPRLRDWQGRRVWIIGASSGIGAALADALRTRGARLALSARRADALAGADLALPLDVGDTDALHQAVATLERDWGGVDLIVYAAGIYAPMRAWSFDLQQALAHDDTNYRGALRVLDAALPLLLAQRHGHLALVASVAGWRGLPQALSYGPTKAALISLGQTLQVDLAPRGIGVSVISPGFVRTRLVEGNRFPMPGLIEPAQAAEAILQGWANGRFEIHFPRRFTLAMRLLRLLPDSWALALLRRVAPPY